MIAAPLSAMGPLTDRDDFTGLGPRATVRNRLRRAFMRPLPVFAILLAVAPPLAAQEPAFLFSTDTRDVVAIGDLKGAPNITVRPNTARELNLYVCNRALDPHDARVQLLDATAKVIATAELKRALAKAYTRVKFAKPAPPPAVQKALPPVPLQPLASNSWNRRRIGSSRSTSDFA